MSFEFPKIYPITSGASELSHCEQVKRLIDGGATIIQLRDKLASARSFYQHAAEALRVARAARVKLIINDRLDIAHCLGADGVHLGQDDLPVDAARRILGDDAIIGFSTHSFEQVKAALDLPIDYLAYGPIFVTATKENPDPVVGLSQLRSIKASISLPLIGIGGINASNVGDVIGAGADSAGVISALHSNGGDMAEALKILTNLADPPNRA